MKKLNLIIMPVMAMSLITSASVDTLNMGERFTVNSVEGITLTNRSAIKGQRYETKLTSEGNNFLPSKLNEVTIGDHIVTDFDYKLLNSNEADLSIAANYVTGPIDIKLDLNEGYTVTVNEGISLAEGTEVAYPDEKYRTTLSSTSENSFLPSNRDKIKVTIGGTKFENFEYVKTSDNTASFIIDSIFVTGNLDINIEIAYIAHFADNQTYYKFSNTVVDPRKDFESVISLRTPNHDNLMGDVIFLSYDSGHDISTDNYSITPINQTSYSSEWLLKVKKEAFAGIKNEMYMMVNNPKKKTEWYEYSDWWNYCSTQQGSIKTATTEDIGKVVYVKLNGLDHKVRLIGVDHDTLPDGTTKAHCTFEFENVISINDGVETSVWNESAQDYFTNTTLNRYLNGEEDSVLKKLPEDLQSKIATVTKKSTVLTSGSPSYENYNAKLFPLAVSEMFKSATYKEGDRYKYYQDKSLSIKTSVAGSPSMTYWTRTPSSKDNDQCANIIMGTTKIEVSTSKFPYCVAPAFCI